ncbi:MAG: hypothetical protein M1821_008758 [Bathelium mastoideum]|nr:MAG: hypothetical protein M1821_008758 [Bathelium mastoideum]
MNGTPRLSSAFPSTPQTSLQRPNGVATPGGPNLGSSTPAAASTSDQKQSVGPYISLETLDAPSQRLYVFGFWTALLCWRLYDFYNLTVDETESFWLFLKWIAIDGVFLFALPGLRIPWLEWSTGTMSSIFLAHAILDGMLMFRVGIPFQAALIALSKLLYDRELALSEVNVKPADIIHNSSLILGKQIIHILPEGSALLDPIKEPHCIGHDRTSVSLPIRINQTNPTLIELMRVDLETSEEEMISITPTQLKKMYKASSRAEPQLGPNDPRTLLYEVKKAGRYTLGKVIDESKLEVQAAQSETFVVACPQARILTAATDKCKGQLSNLAIQVDGTPPLKVKYQKVVNDVEREASFQSVQPDDFSSPLVRQDTGIMVPVGHSDTSWARSQRVLVPLNETLNHGGHWLYSLEAVQDALGNIVKYSAEDEQTGRKRSSTTQLSHAIVVHDRPTLQLRSRNPLKVPKGYTANMPLQFGSSSANKQALGNTPHWLQYKFTPEDQIKSNGDHSDSPLEIPVEIGSSQKGISLKEPGLYSLQSVETAHCSGEILEPSSFILQNPPEPDLAIAAEEIFDKCAQNPVGLTVDLDLTGSPPFTVKYTSQRKGSREIEEEEETVSSLRGQVTLKPPAAGHYIYTFYEVSDEIYAGYSLRHKNLVLEQNVKPAASASFINPHQSRRVCIDQNAAFDIRFKGESPWSLEYELVHGGQRTKHSIEGIEADTYKIETKPLTNGGQYTLTLASVTDNRRCKEFLEQHATIDVRHQRPKIGFGQIEGNRNVKILQGKDIGLPVRLSGESPWTISWIDTSEPEDIQIQTMHEANSFILVSHPGTYELVGVNDRCPGVVDGEAKRFDVQWIARPQIHVAESSVKEDLGNNRYNKAEVCEGDEDSLDLLFTGSPPFDVKYEQHQHPEHRSKSLSNRELNGALGTASIRMDTSIAGNYEYKFSQPNDANYDRASKKADALVVSQRVNSRPTAAFSAPGKTYSYCSSDSHTSGEELIPVKFTGLAPFYLEIEIKHHGLGKPSILPFPNIPSNSWDLRIPHAKLKSGHSALTIRKVRDGRGCQRKIDTTTHSKDSASASRVQIAVFDAPSIAPLESKSEYCVGDHLSFTLSGQQPFSVFYDFAGAPRKASVPSTTFRRLAERPGLFTITSIQDSSSTCKAPVHVERRIHALPSVRVSKGQETRTDIHEGGTAELLFEFGGTPPFEFTFIRSENIRRGSSRKPQILESTTLTSEGYELRVPASEEGTYEVIAVRDAHCSYARPGAEIGAGKGQKALKYS